MTNTQQRQRTKYLHGPFIGKSVDSGTGQALMRYIFTSDAMDEMGDIITMEATEKATERWREWRNVRFQHNPDRPIGKAVRIGKADGLAWNEMDVRIDDPNILPLTQGDDPVLAGASVGIIVKDFDVNDDEEAKKRAGGWPAWTITDYDFVEISLVDHPANYDAKRVGEVQSGRSAMLFRRRDLIEPNQEERIMSTDETKGLEDPQETSEPIADGAVEPVVEEHIEPEVEKLDAEAVDPTLEALTEIKSMLSGMREDFTVRMEDIRKALVTEEQPEEAAPVEDEPEAVEVADESEEAQPEVAEESESAAVAELTRKFESLRKSLFGVLDSEAVGDEAEGEEADVFNRAIAAIVADKVDKAMQEKQKLQPRKSAAVEQEEVAEETEPQPSVDPRGKLRASVAKAFTNINHREVQ